MATRLYVKTLVANPAILAAYNTPSTATGFSTVRFDDYYAKVTGPKVRVNNSGCYVDIPVDGKEYVIPDVFASKVTQVIQQLHKNKSAVQELSDPALTLTSDANITISSLASNAVVMCKKNNDEYAEYAGPISVVAGDTIYAFVTGVNRKDSDTVSLSYSRCEAPTVLIAEGVATLATATVGATIKYRLYDTAAGTWSVWNTYNPESKPTLINKELISAYATKNNKVDSATVSGVYVVPVSYADDTAGLTWVNNLSVAGTEGAIYFNQSAALFGFAENATVKLKAAVVINGDTAETVYLAQKTNEAGKPFWSYAVTEGTGVVQQLILMDNAATIDTAGEISVDTAAEYAGDCTLMLYLEFPEATAVTTFAVTIGG